MISRRGVMHGFAGAAFVLGAARWGPSETRFVAGVRVWF